MEVLLDRRSLRVGFLDPAYVFHEILPWGLSHMFCKLAFGPCTVLGARILLVLSQDPHQVLFLVFKIPEFIVGLKSCFQRRSVRKIFGLGWRFLHA